MSKVTPESTNGAGKHFPLISSMSGLSPEFTIGGKKGFPAAQSQINVGSLKMTPEKTKKGKFFPAESQVNT